VVFAQYLDDGREKQNAQGIHSGYEEREAPHHVALFVEKKEGGKIRGVCARADRERKRKSQ